MKNRKILILLSMFIFNIIFICASAMLLSSQPKTPEVVLAESQRYEITIHNEYLNNALRKVLNKSSSEKFYSDDFLTNEKFKPTTTDVNGTPTITAQNYQLDLSNTNVNNIIELVQFEFPETLQGINLAGNNIIKSDLDNINNFLNSKKANTSIQIGDFDFPIRSDFNTIIKKINLNNNKINLMELTDSFLTENTKLIYGIQNIDNIHPSGLVLDGEVNPCYFIRQNDDENIFTYTFKYALSTANDSNISLAYDKPVELLSDLKKLYDSNTDKISLNIKSVPNSPTAYFTNYEFDIEFTNFTIRIDENFTAQRKSLLDLKTDSNHKLLSDSPILISGFGDNSGIKVEYFNATTNQITTANHKNYVNITIKNESQERTVLVEFKVVDTIKPKIFLKGTQYAFSSINKEYNDPGVEAFDPYNEQDTTGDYVEVTKTSNLNITKLGVYTITYTATDNAGLSTSITRTVEIKEKVLDNITLLTNTEKIVDGGDIVLKVKPDAGVNISNYKNIKYFWYNNGKLFQETKGDNVTGASTITIIGDANTHKDIEVIMTANQVEDNAEIILYSNTLTLEFSKTIENNDIIIIGASIAVLLIIIIISGAALYKYSKGKNRTHSKSKQKRTKQSTTTTNEQNSIYDIKVVKDYTGNPEDSLFDQHIKQEKEKIQNENKKKQEDSGNNSNPFDF